jgi:hypothetical protein
VHAIPGRRFWLLPSQDLTVSDGSLQVELRRTAGR